MKQGFTTVVFPMHYAYDSGATTTTDGYNWGQFSKTYATYLSASVAAISLLGLN